MSQQLTSPLAITLSEAREEILDRWVKQVKRYVRSASELEYPIIVNTIPVFLENLAEAIDGRIGRNSANDSNNIAEEHGGERARVTDYSPDQVMHEYLLLRDTVFDVLGKHHEISTGTMSTIQKSFDEAIQKSMVAFHLVMNEIRENIVAHLTHDMRTPLTASKLSLDIILKKLSKPLSEKSGTEIKKLTERAKRNIDYANDLIQEVLEEKTFKAYRHAMNKNFQSAEMMGIVESAIEDLSDEIKNQIVIRGTRAHGFWNKKAFRRVVENLISNAVKYGYEETPIEVKVSVASERVMLSVHNKGTPIPVNERELLFKAYQRAVNARLGKQKGWGLGLAFCREVAEEHAGSIGVESSLELGTTFTIDIPLDPRNIATKQS